MNPTPSPSNGGLVNNPSAPVPIIKRSKPRNDPFFSSRKPLPRRPHAVVNGLNGHVAPAQHLQKPMTPSSRRSASPANLDVPESERVSGFSDPQVTAKGIQYTDYKLVTSKRELLDGLRYHALQLTDEKPIDIRNEAEFPKPARLHRRDPRAPTVVPVKEETEEIRDGLNQQEREEFNKRKEARQKEREANLAQVAPSSTPARKVNNFKNKTQQVFRRDFTTEEKLRIQTNYEEKLPWHLEDFDSKHCFVGHNQIASARTNVAFVWEAGSGGSPGRYRLIPVEKVYHFSTKREDKIPNMTIEEVEKMMKRRGGSEPEWLVRHREARVAEMARELEARRAKGLYSAAQVDYEAGRQGEEADLDFDDDFADDEEGDLFVEKDEDTKLAEKRIKEDQLLANLFDMKDEKEYDRAEERERREDEARRKNFSYIRKALEKREKNYNHASDSEESWDSSTDSDEEREQLEKARQANPAKSEADEKKGNISSSGTNTPSGRREKIGSDREIGIPKSSSSKSLKRPGSPNLSDASGTDASTRKKKKSKLLGSSQPTPQPSRPISPANVPSSSAPNLANGPVDPTTGKPSKKRKSIAPGTAAGSDIEAATLSDGGAMSDGAKAKRLKLNVGSAGNRSPPHSRTPQTGSRASSPRPHPPAQPPFPTIEEIRGAIPPSGISIKDFVAKVSHPRDRRQDLIALVKTIARMDKVHNILILRESGKGVGAESPSAISPTNVES